MCRRFLIIRVGSTEESVALTVKSNGWRKSKNDGQYYCWICVDRKRKEKLRASTPEIPDAWMRDTSSTPIVGSRLKMPADDGSTVEIELLEIVSSNDSEITVRFKKV